MTVKINGESLTIKDVVKVSRKGEEVEISEDCIEGIERSRSIVEETLKSDEDVYGINTGFGELANVKIERDKTEQLQKNLVLSHASGVGEPLDEEIVRGVMLLRANTLAKGYSGARLKVIQTLVNMLNEKVHPVIPCKGSVGASGDLAPLAHMSLVLIGEGKAVYDGVELSGKEAMEKAGIETVELKAKEGLALLNGTQVMTAIGALTVHDSELLLKSAQIASAMSLESLMGTDAVFDKRIHDVRPHDGQITCAGNLRKLTKDSDIIRSHKDCDRVQDPYTLRCMPQVYGATRDAIGYVRKVINIEMNSANDNPLIFDNGDVISCGNFHGQPVALAMDFLGSAISEIGNISERTTDKLMYEEESGLPPFLAKDSGLNSGFMIAQYTAASLVSENKVLAHPASVDSIPTSAGQEDHVSMGLTAARQTRDILNNVEHVVAIEMLAASQGLEFHDLEPGRGVKVAYDFIREYIEPLDNDRPLNEDILKCRELIHEGEVIDEVEKEIGELH